MKAYKWILCIALVLLIGVCFILFGNFQSDDSTLKGNSSAPIAATAPEPAVTEFTYDADAFNNRLLAAVNAYRARFSVPAWTVDEQLSTSAHTRATECSILGSKSHTRPDGSAWYTVLGIQDNYNYSELTGICGQSPDDLIRSWVSSESINNELLNADYTTCGIGCEAIGSDVYCVLMLYKP